MRRIAVLAGMVLLSLSAFAVQPVAPTTSPVMNQRITAQRCLGQFKLVKVAAGTIVMPATRPAQGPQAVQIKSFWIGQTEVTWEVLDDFLLFRDVNAKAANKAADARLRPSFMPYSDPTQGFGRQGYPALTVHPRYATIFCRWLSQITGRKYRLPTEAEWEYACRCGQDPEDIRDLKAHTARLMETAWFAGNSRLAGVDDDDPRTHPAGSQKPNAWGIHDMLGNAAEWVVGADGRFYLKGGGYLDDARDVSSMARVRFDSGTMQMRDPQDPKSLGSLSDCPQAGFRVVCEE
jgi:formylglycine-generating enzyme required for sulfatase activity